MKKFKAALFALPFLLAGVSQLSAASNPANVVAIPNIATLQALGSASPFYPTVILPNVGTYQWQQSCAGTVDGTHYISATGVVGGCWALASTQVTNNVVHVGGSTGRTGDIGAQINAAYASLGTAGGKIIVDPSPTGACYSFTTPIVFNTVEKYAVLEGAAPASQANGGSCLNFTPLSGTAITIDYVNTTGGDPVPIHGVRDIFLLNNNCVTTGGCGSAAIGILSGATNGGAWEATMDNVTIQGFGYAYRNLNPKAVDVQWNNPAFYHNNIVMEISQATERFIGGTIAANGKIVHGPSGLPGSELYFVATNIFDNITFPNFDYTDALGQGASLSLTAVHLENSPVTSAHFIQGDVTVNMVGGLVEDDNSTGTGDWMIQINQNARFLSIHGTQFASNRAQTAIIDMPNLVRVVAYPNITSAANIPNFVGGANAALASVFPLVNGNATVQPWRVEAPITLSGGLTVQNGATIGGVTTNSGGNPLCITTGGLIYKTSTTC